MRGPDAFGYLNGLLLMPRVYMYFFIGLVELLVSLIFQCCKFDFSVQCLSIDY